VTGCANKSIHSWKLPPDAEGNAARRVLWAQVLTGLELDADGAVRVLDGAEWRERRQRL
jgi:hypothetical protein